MYAHEYIGTECRHCRRAANVQKGELATGWRCHCGFLNTLATIDIASSPWSEVSYGPADPDNPSRPAEFASDKVMYPAKEIRRDMARVQGMG
jgi:hypothetical protein